MERRAVTPNAQRAPAPPSHMTGTQLPFGIDFQAMLLKILLGGNFYAQQIIDHIKPAYFQNEVMAWAWGLALGYRAQYQALPSFMMVFDQIRHIDPRLQPIYAATLDRVRQMPVTDEAWLRAQTLDFIHRCIFRQAMVDARDLWNAGKDHESYDRMQEAMTERLMVTWGDVDRSWYMEGFAQRNVQRQQQQNGGYYTPTGIPQLDKLLEGGAQPGFVGDFLGYPKVGKTTTIINFGAVAARAAFKNVLHFNLEGGLSLVENRYDAIFSEELYQNVKRGEIDAKKYAAAYAEMQFLKQKIVIRNFSKDGWETNPDHLQMELDDLRRSANWIPDVIILDYVDLLEGRDKTVSSRTERQRSASQDVKTLANRGYAIWTVSQVQRPDTEDFDVKPTTLKSRQIADCYARIRVFDLLGSINQTVEERKQGVMRMFIELLRDNEANTEILVPCDFQKMSIGGGSKAVAVPYVGVQQAKALGYVQHTFTGAPK